MGPAAVSVPEPADGRVWDHATKPMMITTAATTAAAAVRPCTVVDPTLTPSRRGYPHR